MSRNNQNQVFISIGTFLSVFLLFFCISNVAADNLITPSPVPTKIPLAQPPQNLKQLQALMTNVEDCLLPCFWGFIPNSTTGKEVIAFVQPDDDFANLKNYDLRYQFPKGDANEAQISVLFSVKNGLLSDLEVTIYNPSDWLPEKTFKLSDFLQTITTMPDIYLSISNGQGRIFLELAYIDVGVVIQYQIPLRVRGNVISPTIDEPYLICPQLKNEDPIKVWLQTDGGQNFVDQTIQPQAMPNHKWSSEQMTGLSTEAFIQQIVNHPEECIEMLSYPELTKQGYEF